MENQQELTPEKAMSILYQATRKLQADADYHSALQQCAVVLDGFIKSQSPKAEQEDESSVQGE